MVRVKYECQVCWGSFKMKDRGEFITEYCPECDQNTPFNRCDRWWGVK